MAAENDLNADGRASARERAADFASEYYANLEVTREDEWWRGASYFDRRQLRLERIAARELRLAPDDLLLLSDLGLVNEMPASIDEYLLDIDRWRAIISNLGRRDVPQAPASLISLWARVLKPYPSPRVEISSESSTLYLSGAPAVQTVTHYSDGGHVVRLVCPAQGLDSLYDPDTSPEAEQLESLFFALGLPLKPVSDTDGHIPCFEAAILILQGRLHSARDLLLGLSTRAAYLLSDTPSLALAMLEEIALTTADATLYVEAVRSQMVDRPLEAEGRIRGAARSRGTEAFDKAIAVAAAVTPRESSDELSARLGLARLIPAQADVVRWVSNRDRRDLQGPLPQCALQVDGVVRSVTITRGEYTLVLDLPGGGDLSIGIDPSMVDLFGSALDDGTVVTITILFCPTQPDALDTVARVVGLGPYADGTFGTLAGARPVVPPRATDRGTEANDFEDLESTPDWQSPLGAVLASRFEMRKEQDYLPPLPHYSPPHIQATRWAGVNAEAYSCWCRRLAEQFPVSVEPVRTAVYQYWLALPHFSGHLPPDPGPRRQPASGWRSVAEAILGSPFYRFPLVAGLPGWLIPHFSGDEAYLRPLLQLSPSALAFLADMALRQEAIADEDGVLGDEDVHGDTLSERWSAGRLAARFLAGDVQLEGLSGWYDAGFRDPEVSALFMAANLSPEQVFAADHDYINVGATLAIAGDPSLRPTGAGIVWIGTHSAHCLPGFAAAGITLRAALRAVIEGVTVQELETIRENNSGDWPRMRLGLSRAEMDQLVGAGMTSTEALQFANDAYETGEYDLTRTLAWYRVGINPKGRRLWLDAGFDARTAARWSTVVGPGEAASFRGSGRSLAQVRMAALRARLIPGAGVSS